VADKQQMTDDGSRYVDVCNNRAKCLH